MRSSGEGKEKEDVFVAPEVRDLTVHPSSPPLHLHRSNQVASNPLNRL
jgi:hypothetical protein